MKSILEVSKKKVLVIDGAMGTMLMKKGLSKGCTELLNVENPDAIKEIHKAYKDAGADIIITNTFGCNRLKLGENADRTVEIASAGVAIARDACPDCIIAGEIGPLGKYIEPLGDITFDEAYCIFSEQVKGLQEADVIIISTISDIKVLKAAILAAKDNCKLPIISSMTFQGKRTSTGTDVETYTVIADAMGADIIGVNCSEGPEGLLDVVSTIAANTDKPIIVQPNAGMPSMDGQYKQTAKDFASFAEKFLALGVNIIGGCCGTTPEHIKAVSQKVKGKSPAVRKYAPKTRLCSRLKTVTIGGKTLVVGERINPTGKKAFQEELNQGKTSYIRDHAIKQVSEGAAFLDINVGVAGGDEKESLPKAVSVVQSLVDSPIVIDTSNFEALELALKKSDGKPLINSVNGGEKSLKAVLPLAKRYGAAIIALALDEEGIPKTAEKRIEIAQRIIDEALKLGVKREDIIVDSLVLTVATNPENETIILDAVKEIKKLGYKTILGVSNISHGLPNRSEINSKFLTKASKAGLDLAILNPTDNILMENTDIEVFKAKKVEIDKDLPIEKRLYLAILYGDQDNIISMVDEGLRSLKAMQINNILVDALSEVGKKFNSQEYFLPQVLGSAEAMKRAFSRLKEEFSKEGGKPRGKVLFATVENDIHDIGKNIVITLLESHNYKVIDLGVNVAKEKIIEAVKNEKPDILCLSALMTTTAIEMEKVIKELRKDGINIPVLLGGAVITEEFTSQIKGKYAKDALSAVKKVNELIQ